MSWGKGIIIAFALFAIFIGVLVTVCVKQDISLVSKDYYQEELSYQQQIERIANTEALAIKPNLRITNHQLEIDFNLLNSIENGELKLFRPSDSSLDKKFEVNTDGTVQRFDLSKLPAGMYKARMQWTMNQKEYFMEHIINL
jgi:hypothetical protein